MRSSPLTQRRTSLALPQPTGAVSHSHYVSIAPPSPTSAHYLSAQPSSPSAVSPSPSPSNGDSDSSQRLLEPLKPDELPTSSPQLKFQQKEWARRSAAGTTPAPMAWRERGAGAPGAGAGGSSSSNGRRHVKRRSWRWCGLIALFPLTAVVLVLVHSSASAADSEGKAPTSRLGRLGTHLPSYLSSSIQRLQDFYPATGSAYATNRNGTLRSPHHTYAFAAPLPNERGAYAYEEHPVKGLIREAKGKWEQLKKKQSSTYQEAVVEYRRRYGRGPPEGFQHWWYWARSNKVQLLDEYDSLTAQVEPLLSLRPSEIQRRLARLEADPHGEGKDHAFLTLTKGRITHSGASWRPPVPEGFAELVEGFKEMLPDHLKMAVYLHDASHTQLSWKVMEGYRQAVKDGQWVNETALLSSESDMWTPRARTCAPTSSFHRALTGLDAVTPPPGPAFVRNHPREMSYCSNPANLDLHGSTSGDVYLRPLEPSFALSRTGPDGDMVWPSTIQYDLNPKNESSFREKKSTILWRGSPDGIWVSPERKWRQSQRFRLLALTSSTDEAPRPLRRTALDRWGKEYQLDEPTTLKALNERYSNVKATGGPVQCREDVCEYLRETMQFVPKASLEEMADNRYVMDVDGNAYSARFRAHLLSNQVPFKATIYQEWYSDRIMPWVHYVPTRMDYADLYNLLAFFDGGLDPATREGNHDDLAEEIALAGKEWAETHWRVVDMQAYLFRLLLEYGRVLDPAREHAFD
ncbi:hypothetical protein JCM10207_001821 [Rhodosporidiobolus poonsookiae]